MKITEEQIVEEARIAEQNAADFLQRNSVELRSDERAAIRKAIIEADVDGRIAAAVAVLEEATGQAMAAFVEQQLRPLVKRLDALEKRRRK